MQLRRLGFAALAALAMFGAASAFGQDAADPAAPRTVDTAAHVAEASLRFGIPEQWIYAVMRAESAGRNGGYATCFAASARRPVRPCLGEPRPVMGHLPIWRVMAWTSAKLCGSGVAGRDGSGGWQDESGASRRGVGPQNCGIFTASRPDPWLAPVSIIIAIPLFDEPAAVSHRLTS